MEMTRPRSRALSLCIAPAISGRIDGGEVAPYGPFRLRPFVGDRRAEPAPDRDLETVREPDRRDLVGPADEGLGRLGARHQTALSATRLRTRVGCAAAKDMETSAPIE